MVVKNKNCGKKYKFWSKIKKMEINEMVSKNKKCGQKLKNGNK